MSELQFNGLGDFAARFPQVGLRFLEEVAKETQRELMARGLARGKDMTPEGPHNRQRTYIYSRPMAGQWNTSPKNAQAAIDRLLPTKIINRAAHARVIDMGLRTARAHPRRSKSGDRFIVKAGRGIGSSFAPRGISGPLVEELMGQMDEIVAAAVAKAEARFG